ncbi:MAG TPA: GIY-YIG nuclease family protein, partial [Bacteroidales bacterium]|nr:GIY-YIG nuclease family protein [Bacteroidales bacterium]
SRCFTNTKNMAGYGGQSPLSQQYWYVYILKCNDGSIYTGCTNNLEDRIKRHNLGQVLATKKIMPVEIITYIAFTDKYKAYAFERYLKLGSGRAFSKKHLV